MVMLLMVTFNMTKAQKMVVESFVKLSQAEDPDAKDPTFRKADTQASRNGRYCAIIKMITTVQDKAFTFDLGHDYVPEHVDYRENGEIWIYVPAGTNKIKISHRRYGQLDTRDGYYSFRTAGISKCEAATVYRLRLHTDFNPDEDIIKDANKLATIKFKIFPNEATVILRKIPETTNSAGVLEKQMPLGVYHYRVTASDYHDYDGTFELSNDGETKEIDIRMSQAFGWMTLYNPSAFSEGTITIDSMQVTPSSIQRLKVGSGAHMVNISHPKYYPLSMNIQIQDSVEFDLKPEMRPRLGRLMVTTNLPKAQIKVDGKELVQTSFDDTYELMIGHHDIEISHDNYRTEHRTVDIEEGKTTNLSVLLVDIAKYLFSTTPSGALLYIDGKEKGTTPCEFDLASGDYPVKVIKKKYRTIEKTMHFDSSNPNVSLKLSRQYQQKHQVYVQPTLQCGALMGFGGGVGCYFYNVNVEAMFLFGMSETDPIYWNYLGSEKTRPVEETFKSNALSFRAGYGFVLGTRFRLTPQVGCSYIAVNGSQNNECTAMTASLGLRAECIVANHFGISLSPDYSFSLSKSDNFTRISETLTQLNDMAGGFNVRLGFYLYF